MKRLTNKKIGIVVKGTISEEVKERALIYEKLQQLENIEEKLDIDLITLEKALKEGVYTIHSNGERRIPCLAYNGAVGYILDFKYEQEAQYILSDYGKTWALNKEELENG